MPCPVRCLNTRRYEEQHRALTLLLHLARLYSSSAKSVHNSRSFRGAHAVVMGALLALADAFVRIHATNKTSVLAMVVSQQSVNPSHWACPEISMLCS